jgi:hypothetical protein
MDQIKSYEEKEDVCVHWPSTSSPVAAFGNEQSCSFWLHQTVAYKL